MLFDSLAAAKARNVDVVLCDTAGRLHNKVNLLNELGKLRKIIDRETPDAAKETLLVLDATTGQNGLQQAKVFLSLIHIYPERRIVTIDTYAASLGEGLQVLEAAEMIEEGKSLEEIKEQLLVRLSLIHI